MKSRAIFFIVFLSVLSFATCRPRRGSVYRGSNSSRLRIIGGTRATGGDFPWVVYIKKIGGRSITCTGELISKRWVVTAAHCILNDNDSGYRSPYPLGNTQLVLGCADLSQPGCKTYTVKTLVAHPCYTPSYDQDHDDIAMMELTEDADIDPADLALVDGINGTAQFDTGSTVTLAGFGTVSNTNLVHSQYLMRVDVGVVGQSDCERQNPYSLRKHYIDFRYVICTGGESGKDSCLGDSGGPVIYTGSDGKSWLTGVLSKGSELPSYTDWCAVAGRYGMYTRIRNYADFVYTTMQGRTFTCSSCPCIVDPPFEGLSAPPPPPPPPPPPSLDQEVPSVIGGPFEHLNLTNITRIKGNNDSNTVSPAPALRAGGMAWTGWFMSLAAAIFLSTLC